MIILGPDKTKVGKPDSHGKTHEEKESEDSKLSEWAERGT